MHVLLDGTVNDWINRSGKLLLFFAGLTGLIDVIGPERFGRWADSATTRSMHIRAEIRNLRTTRPLLRLAAEMVDRATSHVGENASRFSSPWFTAVEFDDFELHTRQKIEEDIGIRPYSSGIPAVSSADGVGIGLAFVDWDGRARSIAYQEVFLFLSDRVPQEQRSALQPGSSIFEERNRMAAWTGSAISYLLILALLVFVPLTFVLASDRSIFSFILIIIMCPTLGVGAALVTSLATYRDWGIIPPLKIALLITRIRIGLTRGTLVLIGPERDGWRLRFAALVAFVLGSLLDLIVSW